MIERLRDALAPPRAAGGEQTGYRRLLRWAALPVTDRRWAAPLSAVALGFGLFAGVAIGPGAAGTLATAPFQIIEMPSLAGGDSEEEEELAEAPESSGALGGEEESSASTQIVSAEGATFEPEVEEPAGNGAEPQDEKEPAEPEDQVLAGTVAHVNPAASSYTVAEVGGVMSAVHAGKLPSPGAQVEVPIRALANGTLAEAGKRVKTGAKTKAKLAGIVTYVDADPAAPGYAVSNRGASLFVRVDPDPAGATPPLPVLGAYASLSVGIEARSPAGSAMSGSVDALSLLPPADAEGRTDASGEAEPPAEETPEPEPVPTPTPPTLPAPTPAPAPPTPACAPDPTLPTPAPIGFRGTLRQRGISAAGVPFTHADFEGIVATICPATRQLLISADDVREGGHDLLFTAPDGIDTTAVAVGESVLASADIAADGSLSLTGLASDERTRGADNAKATQGDLVPEKSKGAG